jgi:hypothetical protein
MNKNDTDTITSYIEHYLLHIEPDEIVVIRETGEEKVVLEVETIGDDVIVYMCDNTSYHYDQVMKKSMKNVTDVLSKEWGKVSDDIFDTLDFSEPKTINISKKYNIYCLEKIKSLWTKLKKLII